jgi:hypothetical protein
MKSIRAIAILLLLSSALCAQKADKKAADPKATAPPKVSPTGVSIGLPFYPVDDAFRLKIRDLEYKSDQLEIDIQRMKVKIEEDKAEQAAVWKEIGKEAAQYAKDHTIDPDKYDFDGAEVKFPQKKAGTQKESK